MATSHSVIRSGVQAAARALELQAASGGAALREKHFRTALLGALESQGNACAKEVRPDLPGWPNIEGGRLGGVDLAVLGADGASFRYLAELKWCYRDKLWEILWDAFKASLASQLPGVEAGYVIAGAPDAHWSKPVDCAELFANDGPWPTRELISRYTTNWSWLLGEGSKSQPQLLPELIQTELAAEQTLELGTESWTIRAVAVRPVGDATIELENGWPVEEVLDLRALPSAAREQIETLRSAIASPVPEDVVAWRYFDSPVLYEQAERLVGVEIWDRGFTDLTLAQEVALKHLPTAHPVLAAILLPEGTLVAPTMLILDTQDADVLLGPGARFRVIYAKRDSERLEVGLRVVT